MRKDEKETVLNRLDAALDEVEIVGRCLTDALCWMVEDHMDCAHVEREVVETYAVGVRSFHKLARTYLISEAEEALEEVLTDGEPQVTLDTDAING